MLQAVAKGLLRAGGWRMVGDAPSVDKAVLIAAPHTSNWDGFWALVYKVAMQLDIRWFAKHSLFWFPLSIVLRSLGGIPLDRKRAGSAVARAVEMFDDNKRFYFGLAPEGTRSRMECWKSGFYRIAEAADVPVIMGFLDYTNRRIGLGPSFRPSGNTEHDLQQCRRFYLGIEGRWPDKASPIRFAPRRTQ